MLPIIVMSRETSIRKETVNAKPLHIQVYTRMGIVFVDIVQTISENYF